MKQGKIILKYQFYHTLQLIVVKDIAEHIFLFIQFFIAVSFREIQIPLHIQMRVWDDYCEVWNEGELPTGYTPETLLGQHSSRPRNRNIAYAFFKAGFIDAWGRGYKKIREGFEGAGLPMPKIESAFGGVRVTFQRNNVNNSSSNVTKKVIKDVIKELSERQKVILELVAANSFVTTTEMSQKTGVVLRTIMRDIDDLQEKGVLKRNGGRKDGEWVIVGDKS